MSDFTKRFAPARTAAIIRILLIVFVLLVVFLAGMSVGWRKAEFSYRFSDNYYRSFGGKPHSTVGMMGMPDPDDLIGGHGAAGKVLSVRLPTIIVSDKNGMEKTINITPDTIIRSARSTIASTTITDQDFVVIIGTPDASGRVVAKFVRVLPPPPGYATSSSYVTP